MKVIRSISAIFFALLVLVSSTSFMVGMHICMGEVQNVAFFTEAEACEMEKSLPPCHRHMKASCCDDESVIHNGDDFQASVEQISVVAPAPMDIEQPLVVIAEIIPAAPMSRFHYYNYDPPLRSEDLTVEHRVFLI